MNSKIYQALLRMIEKMNKSFNFYNNNTKMDNSFNFYNNNIKIDLQRPVLNIYPVFIVILFFSNS